MHMAIKVCFYRQTTVVKHSLKADHSNKETQNGNFQLSQAPPWPAYGLLITLNTFQEGGFINRLLSQASHCCL